LNLLLLLHDRTRIARHPALIVEAAENCPETRGRPIGDLDSFCAQVSGLQLYPFKLNR
jgi:hypothetical protein